MAALLYDDFVMDHIRNARNYRALEDADCSAQSSNPLCGDDITVYLKLDGDCISDIGYQASCCGICMASASMMTEMVKGKRVAAATDLLHRLIERLQRRGVSNAAESGVAGLALIEAVQNFPARVGCAALPWTTLESALNDRAQQTAAARIG